MIVGFFLFFVFSNDGFNINVGIYYTLCLLCFHWDGWGCSTTYLFFVKRNTTLSKDVFK